MDKDVDVSSPDSPSDGEYKKRTLKACDRCRLKKVKCSGSKPCARCSADDAVCHFGSSTKSDAKPVSAAHASQLLLQQALLVKALRILWSRLPEPKTEDAITDDDEISVHKIIQSLGLLDDNLDPVLLENGINLDQPPNSNHVNRKSRNSCPRTQDGDGDQDGFGSQYNPPQTAEKSFSMDESTAVPEIDMESANDQFFGDFDVGPTSAQDLSFFYDLNFGYLAQQTAHPSELTLAKRRGQNGLPRLGIGNLSGVSANDALTQFTNFSPAVSGVKGFIMKSFCSSVAVPSQ